jgi:hypothetical protein
MLDTGGTTAGAFCDVEIRSRKFAAWRPVEGVHRPYFHTGIIKLSFNVDSIAR